ncbi:protein SEEDLING PLASTID DEVELOPMENT 1-like [Hibiscus syriacus]|uniref:protein SEEDLING PLASTID DEVELOPMENT 1-like n=1 Tax=Hibiscus syriacus TaxID=106335 RepID=UPI001923D2F2|nr:protein SEEDLING PLASTID DEVELOPMENT 1-like [Hibiscus syriacus]
MLSHSLFHYSPPSISKPKSPILFFKSQFPPLNPYQNRVFPHFFTKRISGYPIKSPAFSSSSLGDEFDVELGSLLALLPEEMRRKISEHEELRELIEVVMDIGRKPLARFPSGDFELSDCPITVQDIEHATSQVGDFAIDNRAGISLTLHRISAIRNRKGAIIGLTCRVGRAISGSADLLRDLVQDGASLLLIGPPGVGKTTIIRDIARMLANDYKKRVMIVDTSNEIGGDGDIPHAGIGNARRMQVPDSDMQHKVLIEAVENHMPQVIVIDEIGTKLEAMAACTIAQRGIQLVATAHGVTIENLIMNPSLEILIGGIQSVTLGDEEANRRGVQKTVLERKGPSTFSCGVEIVSKTELRVHRCLEATVDAVLSGRFPRVEIRKMNSRSLEQISQTFTEVPSCTEDSVVTGDLLEASDQNIVGNHFPSELSSNTADDSLEDRDLLCMYVYGIQEASVIQGLEKLKMDAAVRLTDNISEADVLFALLSKLRKNSGIQAAAKSHRIPVYVAKTSSSMQITNALELLKDDYPGGLKNPGSEDDINILEKLDALEEARIAIEQVVIPRAESVELLPRPPQIVSLQIELIQKYQLQSEKVGKGSDVRLRILPFQSVKDDSDSSGEDVDANEYENLDNYGANGSSYSVDRLPFLPD